VTTLRLARAARALRAPGGPAQAAQAGLSKSSRGALAGLGADIARLHAWLCAARAGAARRGKEGGSSASSPYAWGKGGGCAGAGKGSEATCAMPGRSAPMLVGGQRRCRVGVGASEALVGALGVGGERTGFG